MTAVVISEQIDFTAERFFNVWHEALREYSGEGLSGTDQNSVPGHFGVRVAARFGASPNSSIARAAARALKPDFHIGKDMMIMYQPFAG